MDSLFYVHADCIEAMIANPQNPKCEQYADEAHYCAMDIRKRKGRLDGRPLR